jgi:hypothetical protein
MPKLILQVFDSGPDPDYTSHPVEWPVVPAKGDAIALRGQLYTALSVIHVIEKNEVRVTLWPEQYPGRRPAIASVSDSQSSEVTR